MLAAFCMREYNHLAEGLIAMLCLLPKRMQQLTCCTAYLHMPEALIP